MVVSNHELSVKQINFADAFSKQFLSLSVIDKGSETGYIYAFQTGLR
jgi:hypothetical protein